LLLYLQHQLDIYDCRHTITALTCELYYAFKFNYFDLLNAFTEVLIVIVLSYSSRRMEYGEKINIIQIEKIKQMNEDLKNILMTLPEGVFLINKDTN
jgi:hypothetical protein